MTEAEFKMFKQAMGEQGLTKSSVKDVRVLCSACVPSFPLCRVYFFNHSVHNLRFSAAEQPSAGTLKALSKYRLRASSPLSIHSPLCR